VISRQVNIPSVVNMTLPSGSKVAQARTTFCALLFRVRARRPASNANASRNMQDTKDCYQIVNAWSLRGQR